MTDTLDDVALLALADDVFYDRIPFNRELGLRRIRTTFDEVVMGFDSRAGLVGNYEHGILHGGVISAAIDSCAGMMAFVGMLAARRPLFRSELPKVFTRIGTIDMRVDYLRPGEGRSFVVSAHPARQGSRVAVVQAELRNERDVLIAIGTCTYIVG